MGISYHEFWELTPKEIGILVEVKNQQLEDQIKEDAALNYSLARMIAVQLNRANAGKQLLGIEKFYPNLFKEESQTRYNLSAKEIEERRFGLYKEQFLAMVNEYNKRRGEKT